MGTKLQELETLQATLEVKTKEQADAKKLLADDEVLLEETTAQLAADEKFFEETKAACKAKAAEWAERVRLRTEELQGMAKAIEILTSDEAKQTFESSATTLVQLSSQVVDKAQAKAEKARSEAYSK